MSALPPFGPATPPPANVAFVVAITATASVFTPMPWKGLLVGIAFGAFGVLLYLTREL